MGEKAGNCQLTGADIRNMRADLDSDFMIAPYQEKNATGCGYNLTATEFVYSIRKRRLLAIHKSEQGDTYVDVNPGDTVLLLTREYVKLSGNLAGAFYARVQMVSSGFGHISTTLDPGWRGMLLFSINNPTRKKLKLTISKTSDSGSGYKGIATMILTPVQKAEGGTEGVDPSLDNPAMRLDILKKLVSEPKRFLADRQYQNLKKLIYQLEHFEAVENTNMIRLKEMKSHLTKIEKEIAVADRSSAGNIRGTLVELKRMDYDSFDQVQKKVMDLSRVIDSERDLFQADDVITTVRERIESVYRECDYQMLCEKVNQIHALIQKQVPHIWNHYKARQFFGFLLGHWKIWVLYGIVIIGGGLLYGNMGNKANGLSILIPAFATLAPPFISYFLERFDPPNEDY